MSSTRSLTRHAGEQLVHQRATAEAPQNGPGGPGGDAGARNSPVSTRVVGQRDLRRHGDPRNHAFGERILTRFIGLVGKIPGLGERNPMWFIRLTGHVPMMHDFGPRQGDEIGWFLVLSNQRGFGIGWIERRPTARSFGTSHVCEVIREIRCI